jgi:homopolymeric O-antigen transport system permease protein
MTRAPADRPLLENVLSLARHADLLSSWTLREIKVRYKQSFLGIAWAVLQPLSATIILTLVFSHVLHVPTGGVPHPLFYYAAMLPWTMLATAVSFGATSLVNNIHLVKTIAFPREILPLATVLVSLVDFFVAAVIFVALAAGYGMPLGSTWLWVPAILLVQIVLAAAAVLYTSALTVFYRDVRFVVPLGLQLWMYVSPVIYPVDLVPGGLRRWYMLNPMAGVIDSYRRVTLLGQPPEPFALLAAAVVSAAFFAAAYRYFKRAEADFADLI